MDAAGPTPVSFSSYDNLPEGATVDRIPVRRLGMDHKLVPLQKVVGLGGPLEGEKAK